MRCPRCARTGTVSIFTPAGPDTVVPDQEVLRGEFYYRCDSCGYNSQAKPLDLDERAHELVAQIKAVVRGYLAECVENPAERTGVLLRAIGRVIPTLSALAGADVRAERSSGGRVAAIQRVVAAYYDIKPSDITSTRRFKAVARPRQIAMLLASEFTELSTTRIGHCFGGKDHATVIHGVSRIRNLLGSDENLAADVQWLRNYLQTIPSIGATL